MLQLKTKVNIEQEVEINLETPAFFKNIVSEKITKYLGVIEECTITIFSFPNERVSIENDATENSSRAIIQAYKEWEHISEEEFFQALNKALKDFDFKATMRLIHEGSEVLSS